MNVEQLTAQAIAHWAKFRPQATAELKEAGTLQTRAKQAATEAMEQMRILMQAGLQEHEAAEMVLPDYILLPPERGL